MHRLEVFWVLAPCSVVVGYQRLKVHAATIFRLKWPFFPIFEDGDSSWTCETLVFCHTTTGRHNPEDFDLKHHRRESLKLVFMQADASITSTGLFLEEETTWDKQA
jgi:hypothetical protein